MTYHVAVVFYSAWHRVDSPFGSVMEPFEHPSSGSERQKKRSIQPSLPCFDTLWLSKARNRSGKALNRRYFQITNLLCATIYHASKNRNAKSHT